MTQEFNSLVPDARAFLEALAANNSREWFQEHKAEYDARLKAPASALLDVLSADLQRQTGRPAKPKLFRPHRDVRFSKDKTPYHLHLHMLWSTPPTGWFLGISTEYVSVGAGVMAFDKAQLDQWRAAIDGHHGSILAGEIAALTKAGARIEAPELKRVPAPFDKDHPYSDLLKRKSLTLWRDLDTKELENGLLPQVQAVFASFQSLDTKLRAIF